MSDKGLRIGDCGSKIEDRGPAAVEGGEPTEASKVEILPAAVLTQVEAPSTRPRLVLVEARPAQVENNSPPVGHTSVKPVSSLESQKVETLREVESEWRAEWKTISKNRRALVMRLYCRSGGSGWKPVTRAQVEAGQIKVEGPINYTLRKFTPAEAARVEARGSDAIKRYVQSVINRHQRRA